MFTPVYSPVTHGPAHTAQVLSAIGIGESLEIRIVAEQYGEEFPAQGYAVRISIPRPFHALGKWFRMITYQRRAKEIFASYPFDHLVFNDAILGLMAVYYWRRTRVRVWGFINDSACLDLRHHEDRSRSFYIVNWIHRLAERKVARGAWGIFTCSHYLRTRIQEDYGVSGNRIHCLYPGLDLAYWTFRERGYSLECRKEEILFLKSDYKNGGLEILLRALSRISSPSLSLHVAGIPRGQERAVRTLIARFPGVRVFYHGQIAQGMVRDLMYRCGTLCIPSCREGFGIAQIEGLATGIPVVTTSAGGIPEATGQGAAAWFATPGDEVSLVHALTTCWKNRKARRQKVLIGRRLVERRFTAGQMQREFLRCLRIS